MMEKKLESVQSNAEPIPCGVKSTMSVIGGKWKIRIIYAICGEINRFGAMHRHIANISKKMLTDNLRELERDGIISRHVYPQVPPKVEYRLTEFGKSLDRVLSEINDWGLKNGHLVQHRDESC